MQESSSLFTTLKETITSQYIGQNSDDGICVACGPIRGQYSGHVISIYLVAIDHVLQ